MSSIGIINNIIKAYHNYDNNSLTEEFMKYSDIINASPHDIIYNKQLIENLIKNTEMIVSDMLIDNIRDENSKAFIINYCIAMMFKHNKYEVAMMTILKYNYNITMVFNYMQESNTNIDILKTIFSKYNEELKTLDNRKWVMSLIGMYNNIDLLLHVEEYYNIDNIDIINILCGTIDKKNFHCLNTIKYIFENYEFDYNVNFMVNCLMELYYLEHDEAIHYVMIKLVEKEGVNFVDILLNNMDDFYKNKFIDYFITVFNNNLLPYAVNNIIEILPNIKNNQLFDSIIKYLNISENDKIRLNNLRLANY
jgi:hypothetical protein